MAIATFQPSSKDNYLFGHPTYVNRNYGASVNIPVSNYSQAIARSILSFDISALPASPIIASATLKLYYAYYQEIDPVGLTVWAYKLTRPTWVELEASWNSYSTGNAWTTPGGDYVTSNPAGDSIVIPASVGWVEWDIEAIVQDAIDNSLDVHLLIKFANETKGILADSAAGFRSNDYTTDITLRPKLVITYFLRGAIWVKGTYLHYWDNNNDERRFEGTVTGNTGTAGKVKVKGTKFVYIDNNGDERDIEGTLTGNTVTAGDMKVKGTQFRYGGNDTDQRYIEGSLV